ncbi:MAG: hypothetical protein IPM40_14920 [Gammaproteobacteria bacterium]|nr:hypothetical protein [Gammaproteobacteria bacterium]
MIARCASVTAPMPAPLRAEPACSVFMEERELADAMTPDVLARFAEAPPQQA